MDQYFHSTVLFVACLNKEITLHLLHCTKQPSISLPLQQAARYCYVTDLMKKANASLWAQVAYVPSPDLRSRLQELRTSSSNKTGSVRMT